MTCFQAGVGHGRAHARRQQPQHLRVDDAEVGVAGQLAGQAQHHQPVDRGPDHIAQHLRVAMDQAALRHGLQMRAHGAARTRAGALQVGVAVVVRLGHVEHQPVGVGLGKGKGEIGLAHRARAFARLGNAGAGGFKGGGETVERGGAHRRQDIVLVLEVTVGRHRAAAQLLGELAHAHAGYAAFGEAPLRYRAQAGLERVDLFLGEVSCHVWWGEAISVCAD